MIRALLARLAVPRARHRAGRPARHHVAPTYLARTEVLHCPHCRRSWPPQTDPRGIERQVCTL